MFRHAVVAVGVLAGVVGVAGTASASTCGTTPAGWNVPAGDPVFVSGPGPIYSVLSAVGEYRSHSMLSRGPDGWVTHATSITPPTNGSLSPYETPFCSSCGSECWNPIQPSFLYASKPGLETVSQGAIYTFLYGGSVPFGAGNSTTVGQLTGIGPGENFIAYQRGTTTGGSAANQTAIGNMFLGAGMAWDGWWSGSDSTQYVWGTSYNGSAINYGWYQYMNVQGTASGVPGVNTGVVCSSSLAMWQHDALATTSGYTGDVAARTYSNISTAANALWNGVQSECEASTGWFSSVGSFFENVGWSVLCLGAAEEGEGVCGAAADQMTNCFSLNQCGNTSSPGAYGSNTAWQAATAAGKSAVGISPDDIGCWEGNGTGAPCSGKGSSIWGWDGNQTVQWNSGGNQYSCWD